VIEESFRSDIFAKIRTACRVVAERARFVHVDTKRISTYTQCLPVDRLDALAVDADHHFVDDEETTLAYFVTLDAVNFGSGYFPCLRKRPRMSGYQTIASSLADRFRRSGPFSAAELASISPKECATLFGQEGAGDPIPELMALFSRAWNDLGAVLSDRFTGSFAKLIEAAGGSADRLVRLLSAQPFFRDVATYGTISVPFFKRAQITASDLALAFRGCGPGRFVDLDRLTIFADNLVPHVLRHDGLLHYDPRLLKRIEKGELIPSGSMEEVEIRACAVHAVALLAKRLRGEGRSVCERDLDVLLWTRGQDPEYKARHRHRTRTVFY